METKNELLNLNIDEQTDLTKVKEIANAWKKECLSLRDEYSKIKPDLSPVEKKLKHKYPNGIK